MTASARRVPLLNVMVTAAGLTSLGLVGCHRPSWGGPPEATASNTETALPKLAPIPPETPEEAEPPPLPAGAHPRILLTREREARLTATAQTGDPSWAAVVKSCHENGDAKQESGYEGEDWANAALDLALCARVLGRKDYEQAAIRYVQALVDDKENVGDGQGGLPAVTENDGYPIRNRGFLASIAYDWLYDAMPAPLRAHVAERFHTFCTWYTKDGYKIDDPIANHYMGYFGACAMGGFALEGDYPFGKEMRSHAHDMWRKEILPAYRKVEGGDFPEGWQYARVPGAALAFYVDTEGRARGGAPRLLSALPWLRATVAFQAHALEPDGVHCWDNADWSKKPAMPFPHQLYATALAFPPEDEASDQALSLARLAKRPDDPNWNWLQAIADNPSRKGNDPRKGPTSYLARGTGTVFARTEWSPQAVWVGLNSGPAFGDHQHLDQGHFEVTRGKDALLIDPGDYDSYSTMSHNTLLVDDAHENIRWSPNQGIWGKDPRIARFEDAANRVYAQASFGGAYNPDGYPEDHPQRSVSRAERELVFSRAPISSAHGASARLVLYDRVTLTKGTYGVTWEIHSSVTPRLEGGPTPRTTVTVGDSAAFVTTLVPALAAGAAPRALVEPTVKSDDMFTKNDPAEGIHSTRVEVPSPKGDKERRFLHVIAVAGAGDAVPSPVLLAVEKSRDGAALVTGAALDDETYVFTVAGGTTTPAAFAYRAPAAAHRHLLTGLMPRGNYEITVQTAADDDGSCRVSVAPGAGRAASEAGTLTFDAAGCALR